MGPVLVSRACVFGFRCVQILMDTFVFITIGGSYCTLLEQPTSQDPLKGTMHGDQAET